MSAASLRAPVARVSFSRIPRANIPWSKVWSGPGRAVPAITAPLNTSLTTRL
jgi:hypothetical protein